MHSSQRDKIFLTPEQCKNSCMIAASNGAFDKNTCGEREKGGDAVWLANNKVCTCSERGMKVTHVRYQPALRLQKTLEKNNKTTKLLKNGAKQKMGLQKLGYCLGISNNTRVRS